MSRSVAWMSLLFGCYGSTGPAPIEGPAAGGAELVMSASAVGPITSRTPANLVALRAVLAGYEVKPANVRMGEVHRLGFNVYRDGERLFYILPDEEGAITTVQAVSPRVAIADHPWKIGGSFHGVKAVTTCKCWEEEVVVCFKAGEHVAVAFARACTWESFSSPDERQDLIGARIQRVLWSPRPYHEDSNPFGGSEHGEPDDS